MQARAMSYSIKDSAYPCVDPLRMDEADLSADDLAFLRDVAEEVRELEKIVHNFTRQSK